MEQVLSVSTVITPVRPLGRRGCRDATDDGILACALAARVEYLVTGHKDLLTFRTFETIPIVTPRAFEAPFVD